MSKKCFIIAMVAIFILSIMGIYLTGDAKAAQPVNQPTNTEKVESTKDRASRAMNNILYGPVETPTNIDQTKTKGAEIDRCSKKTRSGVERGIARVVGGIWQLATFWYSDPGCVTSTSSDGTAATK